MEKFILEVKKSPKDERDFLVGAIYSSPVVLPKTLDYRLDLAPIRNQGIQGSCSAQTAAAMKEWQEFNDIEFIGHMSPQFIYNLRENSDGYGMYPRDTMKILKNEGIVCENAYPYGTLTEIPESLKLKAKKHVISGYAKIRTADELKKALVGNGPCYMAFPVYNWGDKFWEKSEGAASLGGHAVTCVGYTEDAFIIRNSWGTDWGDKGYTYFPFVDYEILWEAWTTIDADSNPAPPEPLPDPEPTIPDLEKEAKEKEEADKKKKELEDDLKKKANEKLTFWQKLFFCFNKKV